MCLERHIHPLIVHVLELKGGSLFQCLERRHVMCLERRIILEPEMYPSPTRVGLAYHHAYGCVHAL
jgi:hypothetical protein